LDLESRAVTSVTELPGGEGAIYGVFAGDLGRS